MSFVVESAADLPPLFRASAHDADTRETRRLSRGAARGQLVPVHRGVYVLAREWDALSERNRHRLRIRAAVPSLRARLVVSHRSAVALHELPALGDWPRAVHLTDPARSRGQTWTGISVHAGPIDDCDIEIVDGMRTSTLVRTLVDTALTAPLSSAVVVLDAGLRRLGRSTDDVLAALDTRPHARTRVAARRAIEFASPLSDSAGESWCRCRLAELGAPKPVLQHRFAGVSGQVDFFFPDQRVVLEFDGDVKYLDPNYRGGLTPSEVVVKERRRERRLLELPDVRTVVRVDWRDLEEPWRLRRMLVEAGVPVR